MKAHEQKQDAVQEARDQLEAMVLKDKWMAVVFHVDENGSVHAVKVSWKFPVSSMPVAVGLLKAMLESEADPIDEPLPLAAEYKDKACDVVW